MSPDTRSFLWWGLSFWSSEFEDMMMSEWARSFLAEIETVEVMVSAFSDEVRCRKLLKAMIWPRGRICPACGFRRSTKPQRP